MKTKLREEIIKILADSVYARFVLKTDQDEVADQIIALFESELEKADPNKY